MTVNVEVIEKWVEALESGEYAQGRKVLAKLDESGNTTFCCLGVLCDLANKAGVIPDPITAGDMCTGILHYGYDYLELPESVQQWAGFMQGDPASGVQNPNSSWNETYGLAGLNDELRWDFTQIAQAIRETYLVAVPA